ncbi:MAG: DUF177 domain-containing protein [Clostridia bacterium]|nr:DUF177 domain-containing protein [Clostridia bacterium]
MELNVAAELKTPGLVSHAQIEQVFPEMELAGSRIRLAEPVALEFKYSFDGEGVDLMGVLSSSLIMNCTKCNEEFVKPFSVDFSERFLKVSDEEAEELDCYSYAGEVLKLDKMAEDLILLNAPLYGLCRPDCKGLCPICGTNLNTSQCSCTAEDDSSPFAALKRLKELLNQDQED